MNRCPSCFVELQPQLVAFRCVSGGCQDVVDEAAWYYTGLETSRRPVMTVSSAAEGVACSACNTGTTHQVCPRCHYDLPSGWRSVMTTCIAMAGARTSGKSVYIGVLKKQTELFAEHIGGALGYANDQTRVMFEANYEDFLFKAHGFMEPTGTATTQGAFQREPMIFTLGVINGQQNVLVLRDVAGEDLQRRVENQGPFAFFRDADMVAFLFDPMMIPSIKAQLAGVVPEPTQTGADPLVVLDNLIRLLRGTDDMSATTIGTPLAIVLGKFDMMHELKNIKGSDWAPVMSNVGAAFNRDPSLDATGYDEDDGLLLQAEVASLLVRLGAQALLNRVGSTFTTKRLFAVSALGAPPSFSNEVNSKGIAPFRVLDPLKWALHLSGAIGLRQ